MPRAAVGRWHRCVTVPIDCRSREASLLSKNIDVVGALVRDACHPLPGRSRMETFLTAHRFARQRWATDRMQPLDLARPGQHRLLAQRLADAPQTHPPP